MKYLLIFAILVAFGTSANAQIGFFKPIQKPQAKYSLKADGGIDSVMNAFRPIANIASYGIGSPGGAALTGAGVSYQHLKFSQATQKWTSVYSINALAWYKTQLDPAATNPNAFAYGIAVGFFNNLLLGGFAYDGLSLFGTLGIGISLNN